MKYIALILVMTIWFTGNAQGTDQVEEKTAVENTIRDYIEGWYKGDSLRMDRSLHDELAKRIPGRDSTDLYLRLGKVPKSVMVELTSKGGGEKPDAEYQIFVDDIEKDIATARLLSPEYLDYLHLAKTDKGWEIVNILFRYR